jgi:hypothetical protein
MERKKHFGRAERRPATMPSIISGRPLERRFKPMTRREWQRPVDSIAAEPKISKRGFFQHHLNV